MLWTVVCTTRTPVLDVELPKIFNLRAGEGAPLSLSDSIYPPPGGVAREASRFALHVHCSLKIIKIHPTTRGKLIQPPSALCIVKAGCTEPLRVFDVWVSFYLATCVLSLHL